MSKIKYSFERREKKYFLSPFIFKILTEKMKSYMKPDEYGKYTICNIYYDTDDWRLIRASLEKPSYKEKLRVRSYGVPSENDRVFVELKKKCGDVVYKRRITTPADETDPFLRGLISPEKFGQIGNEISWFQKFYSAKPKIFLAYDRTALVGTDDPDLRITFDTDIRWRDSDLGLHLGDYGKKLLDSDKILMEIKTAGACPLWLSRLLSETKVFPVSFSKYGCCYRENILAENFGKEKKEEHFCA